MPQRKRERRDSRVKWRKGVGWSEENPQWHGSGRRGEYHIDHAEGKPVFTHFPTGRRMQIVHNSDSRDTFIRSQKTNKTRKLTQERRQEFLRRMMDAVEDLAVQHGTERNDVREYGAYLAENIRSSHVDHEAFRFRHAILDARLQFQAKTDEEGAIVDDAYGKYHSRTERRK